MATKTARPPAAELQTACEQPHETASHFVGEGRHDSDAPHPKQSRVARGKDKNKNQDYKAAATTTAGTAAAQQPEQDKPPVERATDGTGFIWATAFVVLILAMVLAL